jgi:hypothetical protein
MTLNGGDAMKLTTEQRTVHVQGESIVVKKGTALPCLTPFGVCLVKVLDFRAVRGKPQFLCRDEDGQEAWIPKGSIYYEWPD